MPRSHRPKNGRPRLEKLPFQAIPVHRMNPMTKSALPLALFAGLAASFCTPSLRAQTSNAWDFTYTGSIVTWTVPISGYYDVTAYGAQGGGVSTQTMNSPTITSPAAAELRSVGGFCSTRERC